MNDIGGSWLFWGREEECGCGPDSGERRRLGATMRMRRR